MDLARKKLNYDVDKFAEPLGNPDSNNHVVVCHKVEMKRYTLEQVVRVAVRGGGNGPGQRRRGGG